MTSKLGPDVVSDEGLRELVGVGYQVLVICLEPAIRKDGVFYGLWGIRCISADGKVDRLLVTAPRRDRGGDRARTFKTLTGLVAYLLGLGIRTVTLPLEQGGRAGHYLAHHGPRPA